MTEYRIFRTPGSLIDLEKIVVKAMADGWSSNGPAFRSLESREWCKEMVRAERDGVRMKEPKR